jgi:hypothetical protein
MTTYVWFVRGAEHAAMCRTSVESVKKADRDAQIVIASDDLERVGDRYCMPVRAGMPIMIANVEAQLSALIEWGSEDDSMVFLDTDILLLRPLPSAGELTVTWRDHVLVGDDGEKLEGIAASMPYNYGVIRAQRNKATIEAFIWMRERIRKMHPSQQKWYGNQLALAELSGPRPAVGVQIDSRRIPWLLHEPSTLLTVGKIPCEFYNYTPQSVDEDVSQRSVLHFKGGKRGLMEGFAKKLGLGWYV